MRLDSARALFPFLLRVNSEANQSTILQIKWERVYYNPIFQDKASWNTYANGRKISAHDSSGL